MGPVYIAEISPEKLRGRLLSFVAIYTLAGGVVSMAEAHWATTLPLEGIHRPSVIYLFLFFFAGR